MNSSLSNYLRSHRQKAHLTQGEVAFLLGAKHGTTTTRHEEYLRAPSLNTALKYSAVFRLDPRILFAGRFERMESEVIERAKALLETLPETPDHPDSPKRDFLYRLAFNPDVYYQPCEDDF